MSEHHAPVTDTAPGGDTNVTQIADLVIANHILYDQGVVDAFGHVSIRHPQYPDRFLLARNMAPGLVTKDDIIEFDLEGTPLNAGDRKVYLERFIHGEIYKARPDVMAVVHSHSPTVVPFSIVKNTPFRAVCHMAGFIGVRPPVYEIRDFGGDGTDLLVTNNALGEGLASTLGEHSLVLMRGHGSTVVADSLRKAVYRAVYTEVNARTQADAMRIGEINPLSEAEATTATHSIEGQVERAWNLWKVNGESTHATLKSASGSAAN
ncbi:class II aldolase/adducin family protein [Pusillimonas sp.]|uniref:class II aldolase/adducin family protein n=1 Tax=Pusillimonas sp. TaxID=3040095 RepID=UPI0029B67FF1|nr:class II aldolase/adducin family protein [Pusillimonas sp.]MDX3895004.1 class II aldolase/adducin family protein [Pusillimonas sp.]